MSCHVMSTSAPLRAPQTRAARKPARQRVECPAHSSDVGGEKSSPQSEIDDKLGERSWGTREVPLYIHIYIYRPKAKHASSSDRDRAGEHHRRILLGGPRGPGSKAWIKRCDYHKSRGDPVALSSHQVATSSLSARGATCSSLRYGCGRQVAPPWRPRGCSCGSEEPPSGGPPAADAGQCLTRGNATSPLLPSEKRQPEVHHF